MSRLRDETFFGKTIDEHMDAGTCYCCGKEVDCSKGIHGATGAHWSCIESLSYLLKPRDKTPYLARANGGWYVHTVDPATDRALCGHKPKNTAKRMKQRGGWLRVSGIPQGKFRCPHCEKLAPSDL